MTRHWPLHLLGALALALTASVPALGKICTFTPPTLRRDIAACRVVLYGRPTNRRVEMDGSVTVEFVITSVLKSHPALNGRKSVRLPWPAGNLETSPCVLICDEFRGGIEPYREFVASPAVADYCKGLLTLDAKNTRRRLRYYFNYLDHPDENVALDAFREFTETPDAELGKAARDLSPQKLRAWIQDPATTPYRLRLYSFLLGHCGGDADAARLRALAQKMVKAKSSSYLDGVVTGYILLKPKEGLAYVRSLAADPTADYVVRYQCLVALRYFETTRRDVVGADELLDVLRLLLRDPDLVDFVVEDLRKWKNWKLTPLVLSLYVRAPYKDKAIIRRAILRYALQCPRREATAFVAILRVSDAEMVQEAQELLRLETGK